MTVSMLKYNTKYKKKKQSTGSIDSANMRIAGSFFGNKLDVFFIFSIADRERGLTSTCNGHAFSARSSNFQLQTICTAHF